MFRRLLAVSFVLMLNACGGADSGQEPGSNTGPEIPSPGLNVLAGAVVSGPIGSFPGEVTNQLLFFASGANNQRLFFTEEAALVDAFQAGETVPFAFEGLSAVTRSRDNNAVLSLSTPSGFEFYRSGYRQFLTENEIRIATGNIVEPFSLLDWTEDMLLVSFTDNAGGILYYLVSIEFNGEITSVAQRSLEQNERIHCFAGPDGNKSEVLSVINDESQTISTENSSPETASFSIEFSLQGEMLVSCVNDPNDGPKVIMSYPENSGNPESVVFFQEDGTVRVIIREGKFQFPWGSNAKTNLGDDVIQLHDGRVYDLSDDPNFILHHMDYNASTNTVHWISSSASDDQLRLTSRSLTSIREGAIQISR